MGGDAKSSPPGGRAGIIFGPLNVPAAHEHVLARIRRAIQLSEILPGERLPTERELAEMFKVSRITVREALKVLQSEDAIETRRGQGGGTVVLPGASERSGSKLDQEKRLKHAQDVREMRLSLEPTAAYYAALRATDEELKRLRSFQRDLLDSSDIDSFRRADSGFHLTIAAASGNPLLEVAIDDVRTAMFLVLDSANFTIVHSSNCSAHGSILNAIESGEAEVAAVRMRSHLQEAGAEIAVALAEQASDG